MLQQACTLIAMHCSDVHVVQEPHISLTKPLLVRSHERTLLLTKASEAVWQLGVPRSVFHPSPHPQGFDREDATLIPVLVGSLLPFQHLHTCLVRIILAPSGR